MGSIRLFVDQALGTGQPVALDAGQTHYLGGVMRRSAGDEIIVFNGRDGAWLARIDHLAKRASAVSCLEQVAPQRDPPDLWVGFAPIKKARTDFIVEKATEMGAARICPVMTTYTNSERVRVDRLQAHAIEAAEQCGGTFVPEVAAPQALPVFCESLGDRQVMWPDEAAAGPVTSLREACTGPWAILIGPEGGFSPQEREVLRARPGVTRVSLGPRILRADTAVVAALTLWQSALGDWNDTI